MPLPWWLSQSFVTPELSTTLSTDPLDLYVLQLAGLQFLQEVFTIYTPVAFNLATLGQIPASPEGMEFSNEHICQSKIFCSLGPASATEALVQLQSCKNRITKDRGWP